MELIFRKADIDDCKIISAVLLEAFTEFISHYTAEAFAATTVSPLQMKQRLEEGPVWVALADKKILGTVSVVNKGDDLYIRGMGITPEARGKKIGYHLLKIVEAYAREQDCSFLVLSTTPYLKKAINLYEQFGFTIVNEGPYHLYGTPLFSMRKKITR